MEIRGKAEGWRVMDGFGLRNGSDGVGSWGFCSS